MRRGVSSRLANVALAIGVILAVAVAIGFVVHPPTPSERRDASATAPERGVIYLRLPPRAAPVAIARGAPEQATNAPARARPVPTPAPLNAPSAAVASDAGAEPFEPPPPPIAQASTVTRPPGADRQVAALSPPEPLSSATIPTQTSVLAPPPLSTLQSISPTAASPPPPTTAPHDRPEAPIKIGAGGAVPPLRTVPLQNHDVHRVPDQTIPARPVTVVNHPSRGDLTARVAALPPAAHPARADGAASAIGVPSMSATAASGKLLSGPAVVTAALELNVAGKPLRLIGVKLPVATDMCAPNANYAARACADVTRQALLARLGVKGEVSCRILDYGRSVWPAVCTDRTGQDLAAYLVAHGFALADNGEMADYSAAETQAKSARSGLWSYR